MYDQFGVSELPREQLPARLFEIPDPPKRLWSMGSMPPRDLPLLAVVGSRQYTSYGKQVVAYLIEGLRHYHVGIVSGLALGIDTLAHEAALRNQLYTLAVPGSGLDRSVLYPARNRSLAEKIFAAGGGLLSELPPTTKAATWTFPARNRIMAGLTQGTLLIEAGEQSGTLITARMAVDYNRELLVVPGSIFSSQSFGIHQFLKLGATPVTSAEDIANHLNLCRLDTAATAPAIISLDTAVITVLRILKESLPRDVVLERLNIPIHEGNMLLMQMELDGHIVEANGHYTAITHIASGDL